MSLHRSLELTTKVCERSAALSQFKNIVFTDGLVVAFNGLVSLQARSHLEHDEPFAVNEDRLTTALKSVEGEQFAVHLTPEFLILKKSKLTVRLRKLTTEGCYFSTVTLPNNRIDAPGLLDALRAVEPFISEDASRPWSTSALIRGGYVWATNNVALVRVPIDLDVVMKIPAQVVPLLLELTRIDWITKQDNIILVGCDDDILLRFPESAGDWPNVQAFFDGMPAQLPEASTDLAEAAKITEKFSERFVTLNDASLEAKVATIESEFELDVTGGKGTYNARLFSLVAAHATHIDFSTFPKPIYFKTPTMDGIMTGVVS